MEDLTKQQIVLLTLLVSFVTSIATGIVAVSLMDQAPKGVTQTINQIVERTIEKVVTEPSASQPAAAAGSQKGSPTAEDAVAAVSQSVVRIKVKGQSGDIITGMGFVLSKEGVIVTDKINADVPMNPNDLVAVFADGKEFPVQFLQSQILGDVIFLAALAPRDYAFVPVTSSTSAASLKLGETVYALGGKDSNTLDQGLITKLAAKRSDGVVENIETSLSSKNILAGSPLFTIAGEVIGIKTNSLLSENSFYPLSALKPIAPAISR